MSRKHDAKASGQQNERRRQCEEFELGLTQITPDAQATHAARGRLVDAIDMRRRRLSVSETAPSLGKSHAVVWPDGVRLWDTWQITFSKWMNMAWGTTVTTV